MPNPWIILAVVILWGSSLVAVGYWQNDAGYVAERVVWQARDNQALADANKTLHATEEKYRKAEQAHAAAMAAIDANHAKELKNANAKTDELIRAARAGTFRLRDPNAIACATRGNLAAQAATGTGERDGAGDGGLSADAAEFLLALTGRCNAVRDKLAACQAVVVEDRNEISAH